MTTPISPWALRQIEWHRDRMNILREEGLSMLPLIIFGGQVRFPITAAEVILSTSPPPANANRIGVVT